jgi:hypothetical protein
MVLRRYILVALEAVRAATATDPDDIAAGEPDISEDMVAEAIQLPVRAADTALFAPGLEKVDHLELPFDVAAF